MNKVDKMKFEKIIESLRQYQRYELVDENNRDLLDELYVDPLDNDTILDLALKDNTTVLVGRKGTGKSTIYMRMQNELRKSNDKISCYIDVKDVFDKAKKNYEVIGYLGIEGEQNRIYSLQRKFVMVFISELIDEIEKGYRNFWERCMSNVKPSKKALAIEKLHDIKKRINDNRSLKAIEMQIISETQIVEKDIKNQEKNSNASLGGRLGIDIGGPKASIKAGVNYEDTEINLREKEQNYNRVFARIFDLNALIGEIKDILSEIGIRKLFVVLDDYSEIDQVALRMFCDLIINTLNNNSDNFIKLKISAYPGRVELGELDLQKIDIRYLDYYQLYNYYRRDEMEAAATNYTRRIIENRLHVYTDVTFGHYFDLNANTIDDYCCIMFKMSLNVIRHLGLILDYAKDISISKQKKISISDLEYASGKFYQDRLEKIFKENKLTHKSYNERIESFQLEELLDIIIGKSKEVKTGITTKRYTAKIFDKYRGNPFCSHFNIPSEYEEILASLELNFFVSKYNEMVSKTRQNVSVYALNYGLCTIENLRWGKPSGQDYRTYFIESPFNYKGTIKDYFESAKEIYCTNCGEKYEFEDLKIISRYGNNCMACRTENSIKVKPLSENFDELICEIVSNKKLIAPIEYSLLEELKYLNDKVSPHYLARELDTTWQKVAWVAKKIREEYGFIEKTSKNSYVHYIINEDGKDFIS